MRQTTTLIRSTIEEKRSLRVNCLLGDVLEELVEDLGVQGVLHDPLSHDGQGGILGEPLEDVAEDHRCRLRGESVTPYLATA